jgi:hypothetical protein
MELTHASARAVPQVPPRTSFVPASGRDEEPVEPAAETVASPGLRRRRWIVAAAARVLAAAAGVGGWAALGGAGGRVHVGDRGPRIVVRNDGVIVITDGDRQTTIGQAAGASSSPMLACAPLANLSAAEVQQRLAALGTVSALDDGRIVSMWTVARDARVDPGVLYRVEAARRGKLPPEQMASLIAERSRATGSVLVGGTYVLVGGGIPADRLQSASCL